MEFTKLHRERAVDGVYKELRHAIVSYHLRPGDRLNVEELAAKMGVSLTPVRGAIQQLATEGLVEIKPRSGTFVASLTVADVEETFKIRCALECLAAEEAMARVTPEEMRRLKELARPSKSNAGDTEESARERENAEFHAILLNASGIRRLQEMYEALNAHVKIARIHGVEAGWTMRRQDEQAEHQAILAAMESHNAEALRVAMRGHVLHTMDSLLAALRSREQAQAARS
jgi:DNA-binding GntR family transcriptional regulator